MKTIALFLGLFTTCVIAQEKQKFERLQSADANKDGKLSKEELGEKFWSRAAGYDANGDGVLDEKELTAMQEKGRRGKEAQTRPGGANAAFQVREFKGSNGETIRYSLFMPEKKSETPLPLVLCLHGAGGNTAAANLLASPAMQAQHPCIVMAPACDSKTTRWAKSEFRGNDARSVMPELIEALDSVVAETKADAKRLYLTGQSMGGMGTWGILAEHASKFAAAVPVCGIWQTEDAVKMKDVPIWAFHGADDKTVPVSGTRDMIGALKKASAKPEPKYTEFLGVGHGSWEPAYAKAELWEWLFAQRKL